MPKEATYLVPFDGSFQIADAPNAPPGGEPSKQKLEKKLAKEVRRIAELQRILYAHDQHALLLVFQAMDAAGKDGTIRAVMSGVNPVGCQVHSFKQPSKEEFDHDFLWRTSCRLPERGRIGIFNRSYYEEVLVVRVHPEYLAGQRLPDPPPLAALWEQRFESIRDHETHLARNGTVVLKFFLNVSREEQRRRFLARIDEPEKNWKFATGDVEERRHWDAYMEAYQEALCATSREHAPWYAVPADDKPFMRFTVARTVRKALEALDLHYPEAGDDERAHFAEMRAELERDD